MAGEKYMYGVDLSEDIEPIQARDAIIECFIHAHREVLDLMKEYTQFNAESDFENIKKMNVEVLVKKAFSETGGDFDHPNKDSLLKVLAYLREYAKNFRQPDIIDEHVNQITEIIKRVE